MNAVIYSKPTCPFCIRAKHLLDDKAISYQDIDISNDPARKSEMISKAFGKTTVPQIFLNGQHIGGCDDLYAMERSGKLDSLLQAS